MVLAVFKVDYHSLEFNGPTLDLEQNRPVAPASIHADSVVIRPTRIAFCKFIVLFFVGRDNYDPRLARTGGPFNPRAIPIVDCRLSIGKSRKLPWQSGGRITLLAKRRTVVFCLPSVFA